MFISIKQKVAETLKKGHVLLAGDAAHTHSSGFAQGMNTGIHDATNLVWKLAGTLKGLYKADILETYNTERHAMASKLISIDRLAAAAISGSIPEKYRTPGGSNHDAVFAILMDSMSFTMGLGVSYGQSIISAEPTVASIEPGARSPDGLIYHPGPSIPTRLHTLSQTKGKGRWNLIVFAGSHVQNGTKVAALRDAMQHSSRPFSRWQSEFLNLFTLIVGVVGGAWAAFDGPAVGDLYFDTEGRVHGRYGISPANGGIVVVRPDGVFAFAAGLHELDKVEGFFKGIVVSHN
jgi:phenol 2-monooxygenase (NADPH)